ncbi:hypothetical protein [Nannocystis punicea]|uniref:Adhesin domain-containing protein n=1 Tax=Nannocystis punicea TaxID=2995304 RepID=A0ABY7H8A3_9BACT|nr:hypothetical protein [Nannocystis poenicansa]WAS95496.1 hypothetical protein O0S08_04985 [Nannocystis poenicansa]
MDRAATERLPRSLASGAAALALVAAAAGCGKGIWYEFTEGFKYVEPFDHIDLDVDRGSLTFVAWPRPDATMKRHTSGFDKQFGPAEAGVEDGVLVITAACKTDDRCWYDHMLEFPTGVSVALRMQLGYVEIGYVDRELTAEIDEGGFAGVQLAGPVVDVSLGTGDIDVELVARPERVTLRSTAGDIALVVPTGSYRCEFAAPKAPAVDGITCDPAADAVLDVTVDDGALTVTGA